MTSSASHLHGDVGAAGTRSSHDVRVSGLTAFASILMIFGGGMGIFQGIAAIVRDNVFVTTGNYVYQFNLNSWGWTHVGLGIVLVLTGLALFTGAMWARVIGVVLAGLSMIANFMWLPYFPVWALVLIALDVFVIWALCARRDRPEQRLA